jgi:twinkle protein
MRSENKAIESATHCPDCDSSRGLTIYDDGQTHCFSCGTHKFPLTGEEKEIRVPLRSQLRDHLKHGSDTFTSPSNTIDYTLKDYTLQYLGIRGISQDTMRFYGVQCRIDANGVPHQMVIPWGPDAVQIRALDKKAIWWEKDGSKAQLGGMEKFAPASAQAITITEGFYDAMSAFQMLGSKYPCVAVTDVTRARKECEDAFKYINSFSKIYLAFDADPKGQEAMKEVASLFDVNKVYHVLLDEKLKDPNAYLEAKREDEFRKTWWNSKPYRPKGIVADYDDIEAILKGESTAPIAEWPFPTLQGMTDGIFSAKMYLFKAKEKVGKTEVFRAIEHYLLKSTDYNIGIIHLEEKEKRSVQGLVSYELDTACHRPATTASVEEQLQAYKALTRRDGRLHFYTHFGSEDPDVILDTIRYLVGVCHCKFIFLDHITMLVTGHEQDDERKKLDYISTRLAMMTRELDFTLFLISHVNDNGETRGSRNISKVADLIIYIDRDIKAESLDVRNTTSVVIEGNRDAGHSGPAGYLWFDINTYKMAEKTVEQQAAAGPF